MSLPTQLMPGPGKDQEPETCSNSKPHGYRNGKVVFDRCNTDLLECIRCGRVECPDCSGWPVDGDGDLCVECHRKTQAVKAADSERDYMIQRALITVRGLRSRPLPLPTLCDLAAIEGILTEVLQDPAAQRTSLSAESRDRAEVVGGASALGGGEC